MLRKPSLKTTFSKPLVIFALIGFILSLGLILAMVFTEQEMGIKVVIYVFCSIFVGVAIVLILTQLGDYVEVKNDVIYSSILFAKRKMKISNIAEISYSKELYTIFDIKGRKFATINSFDPNAENIIMYLEKKGVKVK